MDSLNASMNMAADAAGIPIAGETEPSSSAPTKSLRHMVEPNQAFEHRMVRHCWKRLLESVDYWTHASRTRCR